MDSSYRAAGEENAASGGPVKLFAMADLLQERLDQAHGALSKELGSGIEAPKDRQFLGFEAFKHAIDCLRPGDVAMLTTHAGFRATHLEYAVEKGVNVFMEKDFAPDPGGIQQILRPARRRKRRT